ncbi:MAG: hypothetical protein EBQ99_08970, partial [Planctomycetes bacterium]|nr:hypothetical protein [Planctomycetota bacterium]
MHAAHRESRIPMHPLRLLPLVVTALLLVACGDTKPPRRTADEARQAPAANAPATDAGSQTEPARKHRHKDDAKDGDAAPTPDKADKRVHDHSAKPGDVQWLLTMHGEDGKPQGIWGLTGEGELKGPVNGTVPEAGAGLAPHDLRGLTPLPGGGFLAMNAFSKDTRILRFGPKGADGVYPFVENFCVQGPKNPAMVHAYQMAIGPDGQVYASNQDTNTVTRYVGVGQPDAGTPLSPPPAMNHLADLAPGVIVPNARSSPEGIGEVRGISFGPDGLLYVCDRTGSRVSTYDTATGRRTRIVADASHGLKHPIQLAFTEDGRTMFITDNGCDGVFQVDLTSGSVTTLVRKGD